jgi:hypothetical protein
MQKSVSENARNAAQGWKIQGFSGVDPLPLHTTADQTLFFFVANNHLSSLLTQ